jgi:glycosyltransferase involved in cell wall biosynthesis
VSNLRLYLVITTFLPIVGGAEKQALLHARSMQERGITATIVTLRHNRSWLQREVIEDVSIIRVAGLFLWNREKLPGPMRKLMFLVGLLVMSWTLWKHRRHYDVIHLYQLSLLALPVAFVCWLTGKALVVSVRAAGPGKLIKSYKDVSLIAGPLNINTPWLHINGRTELDGDLASLERLGKLAVRLTHFLLQSSKAIVVILSSQMKSYLAEHNFDLPDIQLIPNGVDTKRFTPVCADTFPYERTPVVVCISRLSYQKGIDVLLQAWRLVQQQSPLARLIIVGTGPIQAQLERLAQELAIRDSIEFAGLRHDVPAQLHRGDIAVLPSRFEGMSNAVLEAMACGLPCVATRVSGSEDIIQHSVNGLLVESEDYQGLAETLLGLLHDAVLVRRLGRAARETIEKQYSLEHVTDAYVELYAKIAGRRLKFIDATQPCEIYHLPS